GPRWPALSRSPSLLPGNPVSQSGSGLSAARRRAADGFGLPRLDKSKPAAIVDDAVREGFTGAIESRDHRSAQAPSSRAMKHFGIISPPVSGHIHPFAALGRELKARGHRVTYFQVPDLEQKIRSEEIDFWPIGESDHPRGSLPQSLD